MKTKFIALIASVLTVSTAIAGEWETDYAAAAAKAKAAGKPMLLDFTGSDWCGWCMKLDKEVFSKKEFKDYAKASLICVTIDFPQQKQLSTKTKKQNAQLQQKYGVRGYPTVFLVTSGGDVIGQTGYKPDGPGPYVKELQEFIDGYKKTHPNAFAAAATPAPGK